MNAKELKHQHNLQIWTQTVGECKKSDMTVKDWCLENEVNEKRFYYWQRRVREEVLAPAIASKNDSTTFVQIPNAVPMAPAAFQPDMVLNYGNLRMELKNSVSSELLAEVIQVIRHV